MCAIHDVINVIIVELLGTTSVIFALKASSLVDFYDNIFLGFYIRDLSVPFYGLSATIMRGLIDCLIS